MKNFKNLTDEELMELMRECIGNASQLEEDHLLMISDLILRINEHYDVHKNLQNMPESLHVLLNTFNEIDKKIYTQYMLFTTFIKYIENARNGTLPSLEEALSANGLSKKEIEDFKNEVMKTVQPIAQTTIEKTKNTIDIPKTNCNKTPGLN